MHDYARPDNGDHRVILLQSKGSYVQFLCLKFLDPQWTLFLFVPQTTLLIPRSDLFSVPFSCLPSKAYRKLLCHPSEKEPSQMFLQSQGQGTHECPIRVCKALPARFCLDKWGLGGGRPWGETGRCGTWECSQGFVPDSVLYHKQN